MAPGNWQEHISLVVTVDLDESVRATQLLVDRSWIDDDATAPFAADLLKSYMHAVVTEADADDVELLVRGLAELSTGQLIEVLSAGPPHLLDQYRLLVLTAVGSAPFARATLLCSTIHAFNVTDNEDRRRLAVVVSRARREPGTLIEDHATGYFMDEYRDYLWRHTPRASSNDSAGRRRLPRRPRSDGCRLVVLSGWVEAALGRALFWTRLPPPIAGTRCRSPQPIRHRSVKTLDMPPEMADAAPVATNS